MSQDLKSDSEKNPGAKKHGRQNEPQKTFFLGSARDYGGMIDYGLTFTKRGRKPYLTLIHREMYHIFKTDFLALILDRTMPIFSHICNINDIIN